MSHEQTLPPTGTVAGGGSSKGLSKRTLGVPALVFMIIAASAPLTVVAGGIPSNFAVTGNVGIPLSFIVLGVCLALFAVGYAAMSAHIRNAGAFYAYIAQGIGRATGVGAAWVALISYNAMQIGIYGLFGFASASFVNAKFGLNVPWWVTALVGFVIVGWLGINKVDLSAKIIGVLVGLEFVAVIVFDVIAFTVSPEGVSGAGLAPSNLFTAGVGAALAFSMAAFMGFESAAIYSEEAKDPARSIARATYIAVGIISLFYAFSGWAMTIGTGPGQIIAESQKFGPDLLFVFLSGHGAVIVSDIAQVLFITSLLAALIAFHNAVARYVFSLGRESVLPRGFARVNARHAPVAGSLTQSVLALVMLAVFAIAGIGSPLGELYPVLTFFTWLTNTAAFGLVLLLVLISVAVIGYFRKHTAGYSLWTRVVAPALAALTLGTVFVLIVVNFNVLIGSDGFSPLSWILPALVVVPGIAGLFWGLRLKKHRPEIYRGIGFGGAPDTSA
ncbi:amino acid permease [Arthrobacter livingstonensis]|uniref:Amino acid permease n=1 Tax=Arthrobacter livingstonensis TaxID=670078 RepID=A0A2V5LHQ4_9MICC|nr:APC family permease [Arthrobacter livingstonensis]PYI69663.1 amino acid permease [Arthrobacter livingstonensis]